MRYTIRKGMFETNSSSMHCVCLNTREESNQRWDDPEYRKSIMTPYIKRGKENDWPVERIDLTTTMDMLSLGWGFDILDDFIDKLAYVYCSMCDETLSYDDCELICKALDNHVEGFIAYDPAPSVDHQSIGLINSFLRSKEDKVKALRQLLFD